MKLLIVLLNKSVSQGQKVSTMVGYIVACPVAFVGALFGGLMLPPLVGTLLYGAIPLVVGTGPGPNNLRRPVIPQLSALGIKHLLHFRHSSKRPHFRRKRIRLTFLLRQSTRWLIHQSTAMQRQTHRMVDYSCPLLAYT
ncbi:hypothetical protein KFU94_42430 [Chloroflexi bacterium TSY]|nr:hypothetical protein [Chloroflexi bacterium TSY]